MLPFQYIYGKRKSVIFRFVDEETKSYLFANELNGLNRLNGLSHLCLSPVTYSTVHKYLISLNGIV